MIKLKNIINENNHMKDEIDNAKKIYKILSKEYAIKVPLIFKDLKGKGSGYIETTKLKDEKFIFINKIVVDSSGLFGYDPDYALIHEFAHAILIKKNNMKGHIQKNILN